MQKCRGNVIEDTPERRLPIWRRRTDGISRDRKISRCIWGSILWAMVDIEDFLHDVVSPSWSYIGNKSEVRILQYCKTM